MDTPIIRQAIPQDIDALISLYIGFHQEFAARHKDAFREENVSKTTQGKLGIVGLIVSHEAEARRLLHLFLKSEQATIFVAEREGKLVGFIEVAMQQDHPGLLSAIQRSGPGYPGSFWLSDPSYRKQGVGRALVIAASRWAQEQKAS
jgi:GNAT superfamily N-acetyltransferase